MILEILKSMLGAWGRFLLEVMTDNPAPVTTIFAVWLAIFFAGRVQLWRIEQKSRALVVELGRELLATTPQMTAQGLYQSIYPRWGEAVPHWAWFIPHRLDLWPVPAKAEWVQQKLAFSPQWIAEVLRQHGFQVKER